MMSPCARAASLTFESMKPPSPDDHGKPPVFGTWARFYGVLVAFLVLQIILYWLITRSFA